MSLPPHGTPSSSSDVAIGFDPASRSWVTAAHTGTGFTQLPPLDGQLLTSEASLKEMADDFGHMVSRRPSAVLQPGSAEDVARMIRFARQHRLKIGPRGMGRTLYGQSQVESGIVIHMRRMSRIHSVGEDRAQVEAGATWSEVVASTLPQGRIPPVIPNFLELSVGGTLSVGGFDDNSFRYGAQVDNVLELLVVTGEGELVTCSATQHRDLFEAVLGGLGQCGVIIQATIRLVPTPAQVRLFDLGYPEMGPLIRDLRLALDEGRFDSATALADASQGGKWTYRLHLAVHHPPSSQIDNARILKGLSYERGSEQIVDLPFPHWVRRVEPIMAECQRIGLFEHPHPWCDLFVPASRIEELYQEVLKEVPISHFPLGFPILMFPLKRDRFTRPLVRVPDEDTFFLFDLLRDITPGTTDVAQVVAQNRRFYERAREMGGTQYGIGAMERSHEDWKRHYGAAWEGFAAAKRRYDPDRVLTPGPGIFP